MNDAFQLKPWTQVVVPHEDIRNDKLAIATYAIELGAVARREPGVPSVYREADKFFQTTYVTGELEKLFSEVLGLLCGGSYSGDRIIQLNTPFGGGKSHALTALLHLARDRDKLVGLPEIVKLPNPGPVRTAVFAATGADVEQGIRHADGFVTRTIWGSLAYQLGGLATYEAVRANDENYVAPAGDTFARIIGDEPTLILLDELVLYLENAAAKGVAVYDSTLARQTLSFIFNLTSILGNCPKAVLLYSLQKSAQQAMGNELWLNQVESLVTRTEARREPVSDFEVLRIVQRRLFEQLGDEAVHRTVAQAYGEAYRRSMTSYGDQGRDLEQEIKDLERDILRSYPFHPDLLKLMYERWGTLPNYQRTRGALQFLATAVAAYWHKRTEREPLALIGPGDLPLDDSRTRSTFTGQVSAPPQTGSVLQTDITGSSSRARQVDNRLGVEYPQLKHYVLGSRLSSAILMYSYAGQNNPEKRGVTEAELVAASILPEVDRAAIKLALDELNSRALYLHLAERRYFFDIRENINKRLSDLVNSLESQEIAARLEKELARIIGQEVPYVLWPSDSTRIPDKVARFTLVYLRPEWASYDGSRLQTDLYNLLENYNLSAKDRKYRNALGFLRPAAKSYTEAHSAMAMLIGIEKMLDRKLGFNLSSEDVEELQNSRRKKAQTEIEANLSNMYDEAWIPLPAASGSPKPISFEQVRLSTNSRQPLGKQALDTLDQYVFSSLTAPKLAQLAQLGATLGANEEPVRFVRLEELVAQFFSVPSFPKLVNEEVIKRAIANGVGGREFGYLASDAVKSDGSLVVVSHKAVKYNQAITASDIDLRGSVLIERNYAEELSQPPAPPVQPAPTAPNQATTPASTNGFEYSTSNQAGSDLQIQETAGATIEAPASTQLTTGSGTGKKLRLSLSVDKLKLMQVIQLVNNIMRMSNKATVHIVVEAEGQQEFSKQSLHGPVIDPLNELGIQPDLQIGE